MLTRNPIERLRYELMGKVRTLFLGGHERRCKAYLEAEGVLALLSENDPNEIKAVFRDLAYLHRAARRQKPRTILEFGVGLSTLVFAHALNANNEEQPDREPSKLHTLDSSEYWLENTRAKLPEPLQGLIELHHSDARLTTVNNELCHMFDSLPNVVPDLIYLDGPDPSTVLGEVHGLTHNVPRGQQRWSIAADILLYEASLKIGATIVVDNRKMNTRFLRRNLKRKWRFHPNKAEGRFTFVLAD